MHSPPRPFPLTELLGKVGWAKDPSAVILSFFGFFFGFCDFFLVFSKEISKGKESGEERTQLAAYERWVLKGGEGL